MPVSLCTAHRLLAVSVVAASIALWTLVSTPSSAAMLEAASPVTTPTIAVPVAAPTVPPTTRPVSTRPVSTGPVRTRPASPRTAGATSATTASRTGTRAATGAHRVTATAGKGVAVRTAPDTTAAVLGRKAEGAALSITCQVKGTLVRDTTQKRSSALWDKLRTGGFVANIYTTAYEPTRTGFSTGLKACATSKSPTTSGATAKTTPVNTKAEAGSGGAKTVATRPGTVTAKTTVTNAN